MSRARVVLAALLSPWSAPVVFLAQAMAFAHQQPSHYELTLTLLVVVPQAYVCVALLGLPAYLWLQRRQRLTWWSFTGWGAGSGVILFWLLDAVMLLFGSQLGASWNIRGFVLGTFWALVMGSTVAATFGLIAGVPRRLVATRSR